VVLSVRELPDRVAVGEVGPESAPAPRELRVAVGPTLGVAAGARIGAAVQAEVEQGLTERLVGAVLDRLLGCGLDLSLRVRRGFGRIARGEVAVLADPLSAGAALHRDLDALQVLDEVGDLLVVHGTAAGNAPGRHGRERTTVGDDEG